MTGTLMSNVTYIKPVTVQVKGHLASGWGKIFSSLDDKHVVAYKATPGDLTPVPAEAEEMPFYVPLFLAPLSTGARPPVGTLYTTCNLVDYSHVSYHAAGQDSYLKMIRE